jgi:hypothetical protein
VSVPFNPSKNLAHISTVFDMNGLLPSGRQGLPSPCRFALRPCLKYPNRDVFYIGNHALVATTSVSMPVRKVGWMTGANFGLWLTGSSLSRLASLAFA